MSSPSLLLYTEFSLTSSSELLPLPSVHVYRGSEDLPTDFCSKTVVINPGLPTRSSLDKVLISFRRPPGLTPTTRSLTRFVTLHLHNRRFPILPHRVGPHVPRVYPSIPTPFLCLSPGSQWSSIRFYTFRRFHNRPLLFVSPTPVRGVPFP